MDTLLTRIEAFTAHLGITIGALEKQIGASKGVLSRALNNGTDIQSKWIVALVENYPSISTSWLLTGEGNMLVNQQDQVPVTQKNDETVNNSLLQMMMEKDKLLLAQAEEIGRLKAELERMQRIAQNTTDAPAAHAV